MVALVAVACAACAAPFQRAGTVVPPPGPERVPSTIARARGAADGRRRLRWRKRARHRACGRHPLARGASHPDRRRRRNEHGRIGRRRVRQRHGRRELETFITSLDWDQLFGASSFAYKNIRRKADARAYPSRLEFGLRGGIVPPRGTEQRRVGGAAPRPHRRPLLRRRRLRRSADTVSHRGGRPPVGRSPW